jgi:hypothetical protein
VPIFDQLQRASFDGLEFPIRSVSVRGQYRHYDHVYLRVPGAVIEKLERDPYIFEMDAVFQATIKGYGNLWPAGIAAMRGKFEQGITTSLTIPTIGSIPAFITNWDQSADMGRSRSGESVKITFKEDQSEVFLTTALAQVDQSSLQSATEAFQFEREAAAEREALRRGITAADFESETDTSIFDAIQNAANGLLSIKDQAGLYGGLIQAKVMQLNNLCAQADSLSTSMQSPENYPLLAALLGLWDASTNMGKNLSESPRSPRLYTLPQTMAISDVATATKKLGGVDDANALLLNNSIEDPFEIPAGSQLIYFAA